MSKPIDNWEEEIEKLKTERVCLEKANSYLKESIRLISKVLEGINELIPPKK